MNGSFAAHSPVGITHAAQLPVRPVRSVFSQVQSQNPGSRRSLSGSDSTPLTL